MTKIPNWLVLVGVCAFGCLAGFVARRVTSGTVAKHAAAESQENAHSSAPPSIPAIHARDAPRSTDTLETLAALDDAQLYPRLALWLADASEPDIAAFWSSYSKKEDSSEDIIQLIFLHWTRLDPQRAIAAGKEYDDESYAWWAWAYHDPQAALTAAIAADAGDETDVDTVVEGICEFHPDWLLKNLDKIPAEYLSSFGHAKCGSAIKDPLELLKFLKRQDFDTDPEIYKALAREDPWTAIEWATQNPQDSSDPLLNPDDTLPTVIRALAEESPDELARIAERTPSGQAKLAMEAALFENLVKTDPAAALGQAKSATVPRTAAERYAALGLSVAQTDSAQAFQLAKDLLAACPNAMDLTAPIYTPDGEETVSLEIPGVSELFSELMIRQPQQVMELIAALPQGSENDQFHPFSKQWIEQDFASYTNWVNQQIDPAIRESGAAHIVAALEQSHHYQEAAEWASSMNLSDNESLDGVLKKWREQDPDAPALWLENADLSPARKTTIRALLASPP